MKDRKLKAGEVIKAGDYFIILGHKILMADSFFGSRCDGSGFCYRPTPSTKKVTIKEQELKHSYICRVLEETDGRWWVEIIGINGKACFQTAYYSKRSYAVNMAKSFCSRVSGVKLEVK